MLEVARQKSRKAGLEITWLCQDAAALDLPARSFDAAVCLYDSLNYLIQPGDLAACFSGVRRCLRPEGLFIFDLNTEHALEAEMFTQSDTTNPSLRYRWNSKFDHTTRLSRIVMEFWQPRGERFTETHYQRAYPTDKVVAMLESAQFTLGGLFEAYTLLPPGPLSSRIFYVARRAPPRR
jgi:SAM-dependent methyltransferase